MKRLFPDLRKKHLAALLALLFSLVLLPVSALAETSGKVEQWLERLGPALNATSYRGVFVYARGDQVHSMRIIHRFRDGVVDERLVMQDGGAGEIVRKGSDVVCVLPDQGRFKLEQVIPSGPFADVFNRKFMPVGRWYDAHVMGEDRVAGYDAVRIALTAKDSNRYSYQLWLEKRSGLLVKSQVQGASGQVLEHFQFTSLEITDDIHDDEFKIHTEGPEITGKLGPKGVRVGAESKHRMNDWELGWRPAGFIASAIPQAPKGHAVAYSDGLATFSVFVEPAGQLKMPQGASRIGATTVYTHDLTSGGKQFLVTVVGEIPPEAARRVAESVRMQKGTQAGAS